MASEPRASEANEQSAAEALWAAIRSEANAYVAKVVIVTAAGIVALAGFGLWIYVKTILPDVVGGVPRGAVMAFDRDDLDVSKCPPGWSPFTLARGRAVIGAGQGDQLTNRPFRKAEGLEEYPLTQQNIPAHQHDTIIGVLSSPWGMADVKANAVIGRTAEPARTGLTGAYGADKPTPVPTMPPFVALYYCKKD